MPDPVIRTCPSCGARLEIADELIPASGNVQVRLDSTGELARVRLERDIQALETDLAKLLYQRYEALFMWCLGLLFVSVLANGLAPFVMLAGIVLVTLAMVAQIVSLIRRTYRTQATQQYLQIILAQHDEPPADQQEKTDAGHSVGGV